MNDDTLVRTITDRAAEAERQVVLAWRKLSSENEQRYQALAHLLELASDADERRTPGPAPSASQIIARAEEPRSGTERAPVGSERAHPRIEVPVGAGRHTGASASPRFREKWVSGSLAAAAVILVALGVLQVISVLGPEPGFGAQEFVTGPDEKATVVLSDGTVVRLASDSRLRLPEGSFAREVAIVGRAFFAVARDASRPFTVRTGSGDVRVLGTRFAIAVSNEDLRLVVVEGRVALSGPADEEELHVGASEMARVVNGTRLPVVRVPDPSALAEWVGNFLAFQDTPLADAVREIEREYDVTIELSDSALVNQTITAWFAGWPLEDVMDVVCIVANAHCEVGGSIITMTPSAAHFSDPR